MPYQRYLQDLQGENFIHDPAQEEAMRRLQRVHDDLQARIQAPAPGFFSRWLGRRNNPPPVKGLYLWGGVGRGKTYLMDTFFAALAFDNKLRLHFHRFMQRVHSTLKTLRDQQDPLQTVADRLAEQTCIICLDEFFVSDITDAMLLGGLWKNLFERGVTLVTTSNIAPDDLYKDGLQRARFLPAIDLIKSHTEVFHLDGGTDYRLRYLETARLFYYPLHPGTDALLEEAFKNLCAEPETVVDNFLEIDGRTIATRLQAEGVVWFDFAAICDGPRSQTDYIEISRLFHTVLISDIPVMHRLMEDQARRFLNLVDEFYDRNVKLIVSAAAAIDKLYQGERLRFEYQRTISRLQEMQSYEYLAREHIP